MNEPKKKIEQALHQFASGNLADNAKHLFDVLGYESQRTMRLEPNTSDSFLSAFNLQDNQGFNPERALIAKWESIDVLFQLTEDEIGNNPNLEIDFGDGDIDEARMESYLFFSIKLSGDQYSRTQLSQITREMNKPFGMPAMILFQHGGALTFAVIDRRLNKVDESKDVLLKATLIKDINFADPHRAHIDILFDLSMAELYEKHKFKNFPELHEAWKKTLDTSELNKRFFKEIAYWYFWAVKQVTFPDDAEKDEEGKDATSVIRLITRLIFVWFIKEKGLVPDDLFKHEKIKEILRCADDEESTYYKAILQNLFFATLNQEMNTSEKPNNRKFRGEGRQHFNITSLYRYKRYFTESDEALKLFESIPFLNGGLFECLDKPDNDDPNKILRVDGFSDRDDVSLRVPNLLFFSDERDVDLNAAFGTSGRQYKVRGLIEILDRYKFTVTENTPIEEEVALDPELLGRVFENLLAAYNPATGATARKQTGSFYTPREIVDYMTDESLIAYLKDKFITYHESQSALSMTTPPAQMNLGGQTEPVQTQLDAHGVTLSDEQKERIEDDFRALVSYKGQPWRHSPGEIKTLIKAIDKLKILDPACGSGAFPMGVLQKMVFVLGRIDPRNEEWKQRQIDKVRLTIKTAESIEDSTVRENTISELESEIDNINDAFTRNELDYGRKLYLIENCIYGVDIQPIAVQIAKLRFFISLVVDQKIDRDRENLGVRPLPNLETKFVAANSLIDITGQLSLRGPEIGEKENELQEVRRRHFTARTPRTKSRYRKRDAELRTDITELLSNLDLPSGTAREIASWDPYDQNAKVDWFDSEWMFGVRHGYDITLGNPPYVRADAPSQHELRREIEDSNQYETLWEKWDLYIPFIERSYKLLKPGGFTTLIVSDAYCHSKYAQKSQNWFLKNSRILRLDFLSKIKVFDAGVHNVTYLFQKADGSHQKPERRVHELEFGAVNLLPTNEQRQLTYRVFFPEDTDFQSLSVPTVSLDEICYITKGMVVHAHERKARGEFELRDLVSDVRDEHHPKPFVEGKHLARWLPTTNKWLEWGTKRAPDLFSRPTFPELYKVEKKMISIDMAAGVEKLRVAYDNRKLYHNHSAWSFIPWHSLSGVSNRSIKKQTGYRDETPRRSDLPDREKLEETSLRFAVKFLLGVMNSTASHDFLKANRRSNIHLYPDDWKKLPIPDVSPEQQAPVVELVDQILAKKQADADTDVSALENEIDQIVYSLYDLTCEEIAIVEANTV